MTDISLTPIRRIVVGIDGSAGSREAVLWAARLARATGAEVLAVHGFPYEPMLGAETNALGAEEARTNAEGEWTADLREFDIPHRVLIEEDDARSSLCRIALDEQADVLVVGSRGHGLVAELVLGSVAHHLTHHSPVPVVVIPAGSVLGS